MVILVSQRKCSDGLKKVMQFHLKIQFRAIWNSANLWIGPKNENVCINHLELVINFLYILVSLTFIYFLQNIDVLNTVFKCPTHNTYLYRSPSLALGNGQPSPIGVTVQRTGTRYIHSTTSRIHRVTSPSINASFPSYSQTFPLNTT